MQLVLLCNEQDFKQFGPAHVFSSLIEELKDLEENGVVVNDGKTLKASLCSIVGDTWDPTPLVVLSRTLTEAYISAGIAPLTETHFMPHLWNLL